MVELMTGVLLLAGGVFNTLLMRRSGHLGNFLFNNKGEEKIDGVVKLEGGEKTLTQKEVDFIVEDRLKRERSKYSDYDSLKTKVSDYEKQQDQKTQKDLEEQKKYDEAKKTYETKIQDMQGIVGKKDGEIQDLRISHNLINEITKQNGYVEETLALLKASAQLTADGVFIKAKDANNIDVILPVSEGVKRFLEARPYLVKGTHKQGAGTPPATPTGGTPEAQDHNALNKEYMDSINRGDFKRSKELKAKLNVILQTKGVPV